MDTYEVELEPIEPDIAEGGQAAREFDSAHEVAHVIDAVLGERLARLRDR